MKTKINASIRAAGANDLRRAITAAITARTRERAEWTKIAAAVIPLVSNNSCRAIDARTNAPI